MTLKLLWNPMASIGDRGDQESIKFLCKLNKE